jgi:hypothetical protein
LVGHARIATGLAALIAALFAFAASAAAEPGVVTTDADGFGDGTLRHEVANANTSETVTFLPGINPKLTIPAPIVISKNGVTIGGNGPSQTTISRVAGEERIFVISGDQPSGVGAGISGVTITGGHAPDGTARRDGGAIFVDFNDALTLVNSVLTLNQAGDGSPGADGTSSVNPANGLPGGAGGNGGAIASHGFLTVVNSTFSDNTAGNGGRGGQGGDSTAVGVNGANGAAGGGGGNGGAIDVLEGLTSISGTTFFNNTAGDGGHGGTGGTPGSGAAMGAGGTGATGGFGGAMAIAGGCPTCNGAIVANSTINENTSGHGGLGGIGPAGTQQAGGASGSGGGIYMTAGFNSNAITQSTIAGNFLPIPGNDPPALAQGAGVFATTTTALIGSLLADNVSIDPDQNRNANCFGNVSGTADTVTFPDACPGTTVGDPLLGPLADNGGPTQTMAIGLGGAAIEAVPVGSDCLATDQRGVIRPQGTACDAGAFERNPEFGQEPGTGAPPAQITPSTSPAPTPPSAGTKKKRSCKKLATKRKRRQCHRKRHRK